MLCYLVVVPQLGRLTLPIFIEEESWTRTGCTMGVVYAAHEAPIHVVLAVGLPGSGKTVFWQDCLSAEPGWIRVSPADLREMMSSASSPAQDDLIQIAAEAIFRGALWSGFSVYLDDYNLTQSIREHWRKELEGLRQLLPSAVTLSVIEFKVTLEKSLYRRKKALGEKRIRALADSYEVPLVEEGIPVQDPETWLKAYRGEQLGRARMDSHSG